MTASRCSAEPKTTCTYHCGACGLHFHSLNAFDAHRHGDYRSNDPEVGRHCVHPYDLDGKLVPLTESGECRTSRGPVERQITSWTDAGSAGRFHERSVAGSLRKAHSGIRERVGQ